MLSIRVETQVVSAVSDRKWWAFRIFLLLFTCVFVHFDYFELISMNLRSIYIRSAPMSWNYNR